MAFKKVNFDSLARFNSTLSMKFLDSYESFLKEDISLNRNSHISKRIAPSSLRCKRKTWFRLKGVEPEIQEIDTSLEFTAFLGTCIHENIQSVLKNHLGTSFLDVPNYLNQYVTDYEYLYKSHGFETQIEFKDIPIKFACDGLIDVEGETVLLEIKTIEYETWRNLSKIKSEHLPQITCYCSLLHIGRALVIYVDRRYGNMKCYQLDVDENKQIECIQSLKSIVDQAKTDVAPEGLPSGDIWCSKNRCPYYNKCLEYGRYVI